MIINHMEKQDPVPRDNMLVFNKSKCYIVINIIIPLAGLRHTAGRGDIIEELQ